MDWKEDIEMRKRKLRGQIQALTPTVMAVLTFIVLLAIAGIMLGKLAVVNAASLGNNTNATRAINIGFDQVKLTQDIGTLIITVVLLLFALGAFFMLMSGKGKRRGQIQALTPTAMQVLMFIIIVVIATIMLGKLAAVNTDSLGANANATQIINVGFDQMKLTQDIGTLVITIVLLLFALGAFFGLMMGQGGGGKQPSRRSRRR